MGLGPAGPGFEITCPAYAAWQAHTYRDQALYVDSRHAAPPGDLDVGACRVADLNPRFNCQTELAELTRTAAGARRHSPTTEGVEPCGGDDAV
jgi:hypothetical protein